MVLLGFAVRRRVWDVRGGKEESWRFWVKEEAFFRFWVGVVKGRIGEFVSFCFLA